MKKIIITMIALSLLSGLLTTVNADYISPVAKAEITTTVATEATTTPTATEATTPAATEATTPAETEPAATEPPPSDNVESIASLDISAESAIIMDSKTGKIIFSKNAYEVRAMASLTKVMSTILTLEAGDLDSAFMVDNDAIHVEGSSMGLSEDDLITRRDLCYGMMLPSGNDAANAAAVNVGGSIEGFVEMMNEKAAVIGMDNTRFANPHGLDEDDHYSTAFDMALMTSHALNNSDFREICKTDSIKVEFGNPPYERWLENNNKMLFSYDNCIGVKTGFTDEARRCLISAAEKDGETIIVVTLNAPDDWQDHIKMLDYGFAMSEMLYFLTR